MAAPSSRSSRSQVPMLLTPCIAIMACVVGNHDPSSMPKVDVSQLGGELPYVAACRATCSACIESTREAPVCKVAAGTKYTYDRFHIDRFFLDERISGMGSEQNRPFAFGSYNELGSGTLSV